MAGPIPLSRLAATTGFGPHELVTVVGGGGKTTTLFELGRQLGGARVITTTTKMGRDRTGGFPVLIGPRNEEVRDAVSGGRAAIAWQGDGGHKALGVTPERCEDWFGFADYVLVEADGAAGHPFKAPRSSEPVVPGATTTLIACIGAEALGRVIADQCHRPLRVAAIAGCSPYQRLTPQRAAAVLLDPRGSMKGRPDQARFVVIVNKVDADSAGLAAELEGLIAEAAEVVQIAFDEGRNPEH